MDDTRLTLTVEEAAQMLGISRIKGLYALVANC